VRIEITCHECSALYVVSVPSDIVSWEYTSSGYNFSPKCPNCELRTKIKLIKGKKSGDNTQIY
jgi:hypothetical protein